VPGAMLLLSMPRWENLKMLLEGRKTFCPGF